MAHRHMCNFKHVTGPLKSNGGPLSGHLGLQWISHMLKVSASHAGMCVSGLDSPAVFHNLVT